MEDQRSSLSLGVLKFQQFTVFGVKPEANSTLSSLNDDSAFPIQIIPRWIWESKTS